MGETIFFLNQFYINTFYKIREEVGETICINFVCLSLIAVLLFMPFVVVLVYVRKSQLHSLLVTVL